MDEGAKETLWLASGLDFFTYPTFAASKDHYISMYAGFSDGLSYFQPCYLDKKSWDIPPISRYPDCNVTDIVEGYDARCRPWY